jgi:hypothetical protein
MVEEKRVTTSVVDVLERTAPADRGDDKRERL